MHNCVCKYVCKYVRVSFVTFSIFIHAIMLDNYNIIFTVCLNFVNRTYVLYIGKLLRC